ncbi:MAG TPA: LTA synthase family protein, partial [Chitinophagaceae bacterium]|nr:LTA synthase family protein [Chitinophagaceae bacterium]
MKKTAWPRLLRWMFVTAIALLVFMTIMRFVFFFHFRSSSYTVANSFDAFLLGLNFDTRTVCGIVLFPFLIGSLRLSYNARRRLTAGSMVQLVLTVAIMVLIIIFMHKGHVPGSSLVYMIILFVLILVWLLLTKNCNPFGNAVSRKIFKVYFFAVITLLVLLYAVDYEHYDYLHQRLSASVLNYLSDAKTSMSMIAQSYPVITLVVIIAICILLIYRLIAWQFKKIALHEYNGRRIPKTIMGMAFALLLGLGIFGRVNQYPLRWSDAFALKDDFKANLSLNPAQSFLSTLQFRHSTYDLKKVKEYYPLMAQYLSVNNPDSIKLNYKRVFSPDSSLHTPNVVIVICESFSAYKSSMWGNPLNTTPYFNEMCRQGIFFDRCFTPAYGTARGVWAVITGIPDVEYPNTASRNPAAVDEHTIINDYTNYDKYYFIGGSLSWANIRGLLTNNIAGLHMYESENYKANSVDVWGISDKRLFLAANNTFKNQPRPFIAVIQTADNHRPYTIPDEDRANFQLVHYAEDSLRQFGFQSNDELNAFRYTDFCFKTFIETAKKEKYFNNTIFVFVGDHGIPGDAGKMFPKAWEADDLSYHHVPLLFYSPALLAPERIHRTCSQADILPSVSALAHMRYVNTTIGKNLFDTIPVFNTRFKNAAFLFDPTFK